MTLSNKILIGFLLFVFLYMTAAFAELRMKGNLNIMNDKNSVAETVNLSGIKCLSIKGIEKQVHVIGSDRAELEMRSLSGKLLAKLEYRISGDTLILSGLNEPETTTMKISVLIPAGTLKQIIADNSSVTVRALETDVLNIVQTSSNIWINESTVAKMNVNVSHSMLQIEGTMVDTLSAQTESSQINVFSPVGFVQGSIQQGTSMRLTELEGIDVKKDVSSKLVIY